MQEAQSLQTYWSKRAEALLKDLATSSTGLTASEAEQRLRLFGENRLARQEGGQTIRLLLRQVSSPLVLILIFGAVISMAAKEWTDAIIILAIVVGSALLGFTQEHRASQAIRRLRDRLALKATVMRDGKAQSLDTSRLVPGDVIVLSAGNLVPADGIVVDARDFLVSQSALTGESFPIEKTAGPTRIDAPLAERSNCVFLGTSVRSGTATVLIVETGANTILARIATEISRNNAETNFERGIRKFGYLLTRIMAAMVLFVLAVNLLQQRPPIESLLFAVALAVGLTPELLPAIVSVTLSAGAHHMAGRGVIVRRLEAIENMGAIDILCTDKTGTLTKGVVELSAAADPIGGESDRVFRLAAINAEFETGIENPLDAAICKASNQRKLELGALIKVDEIPYDFLRKRLTIVVDEHGDADTHTIITKGAFDSVISCCSRIASPQGPTPIDQALLEEARSYYTARGAEGFRVLGVASRRVPAKPQYDRADEAEMVFEGFVEFLDPLKEGIEATIAKLGRLGVTTKIISGDNRHVAAHVGAAIGLDSSRLLTGRQLNETGDEALWHLAEQIAIFAEVDPQQKERIVRALQRRGHAVAYMGDGINDAPALHMADVGVSVDAAVDVARESADIVLLNRDLDVLTQGVVDGRRTFGNTLKYVAITTSANFGNMVSMAIATLFVPFLPLLAKQILLNNFLSDFPSMAISTDNVDPATADTAQRWDIGHIQSFMLVFGLISTVFDLASFLVLLKLFQTPEGLFQSAWFVVSLLTELAVVLVLRTRLPAWKSRPSGLLLVSTALTGLVAIALPYLGPVARAFGFTPLPFHLLLVSLMIVILYIAATELAKRWYFTAPRRIL